MVGTNGNGANGGGRGGEPMEGTTGRTLILYREDVAHEARQALAAVAGARVASTSDPGVESFEEAGDAGVLMLDQIGVAVSSTPPDQFASLAAAGGPILAIEDERICYALGDGVDVGDDGGDMPAPPMTPPAPVPVPVPERRGGVSDEYLRGWADSVNALLRGRGERPVDQGEPGVEAFNEAQVTWGLQATRVHLSRLSGAGIKVAVLDTGYSPNHPDFGGRGIIARSFISGESAIDLNGHGTHCIGTSCGPLRPRTLPRYGVAYGAQIYAGKVLSNAGSGADGGILAGINWALASGVQVISMSLGARTRPGEPPSQVYEAVAQRCLARGTLIVAAAGNDSGRPGVINPISRPANCPSIFAVAAVDAAMKVAPFSNGGINLNGGEVNVAGPGVNVYSSWCAAPFYRRLQGTSMATPHVAGIAALYAQQNARFRGRALWDQLVRTARRLDFPRRDVGAGLVQVL